MDLVEKGNAPSSLAAHGHGVERPVYAYPDRAILNAQGQWQRVPGEFEAHPAEWLGAEFFRTGYELK
jgi:hypothetical protein